MKMEKKLIKISILFIIANLLISTIMMYNTREIFNFTFLHWTIYNIIIVIITFIILSE